MAVASSVSNAPDATVRSEKVDGDLRAPSARGRSTNAPGTRVPPQPTVAAGVPLIGGGRLPLAFIATGLVGLAAAAVGLVLRPSLLLQPHVHPYVVALAHAWLPGFLLSACIGAMYQLTPVILGTPLRAGARAPWVHLGLHASGVVLLLCGFLEGHFELVAAGGLLVATGIGFLVAAVIRTFAASRRRDVIAWCFPLAVAWLAVTVLAGVAIAVLRRWPILPFSALGWLRAHAHLGLVGFFLTLLQGATFQLFPMFTMGEARRLRCAAAGLAAAQAGLVLLATGLGGEWRVVTVAGASLVMLGVILSGIAFVATARTRRRRDLEPPLQGFVVGLTLLALGTILGVVLLAMPPGESALRGAMTYGVVVVAGGLGLTVMGMLGKIIPFLVWMRAYGPRVGREPVPLAPALPSRKLERAWLTLHVSGVLALAIAAWFGATLLAGFGAVLMFGAAGAFLGNVGRVCGHLRQPSRAASDARPTRLPVT